MKKILTIVLLMIMIAILSASNDSGKKAQDFQLENLKGKKVKLSDLNKDKLIILDFWATWCQPCKKLMPHLDEIQKKYGEFVQVVAVDIDKVRHQAKAKKYIKSKKFKFEVLLDPLGKVKKMYNVTNPPHTIMISPEMEIIWEHIGYKKGDEKDIVKQIEKWIESQKEKEVK